MGEVAIVSLARSIYAITGYFHAVPVAGPVPVTGGFLVITLAMMAVVALFLHCAGFILIDVPVLVGIHSVEHYFSMAGMLVSAHSAIIVSIGHGHTTSPLSTLLVTIPILLVAVAVLLVAISIFLVAVVVPLVAIFPVTVVRLGDHVAVIEGLHGERVFGRRRNGCGTQRGGQRGAQSKRNN